jgi:hypothetical protein
MVSAKEREDGGKMFVQWVLQDLYSDTMLIFQ